MHEFGWTWEQLQRTPAYVRAYTWDLLAAKRAAQAAAVRRSSGA